MMHRDREVKENT